MASLKLVAKKKPQRSLEQFAAEEKRRGGVQCWVCSLDPALRKQLEDARRTAPEKYSFATLARYLKDELGLDATQNKIFKHWHNHVNSSAK